MGWKKVDGMWAGGLFDAGAKGLDDFRPNEIVVVLQIIDAMEMKRIRAAEDPHLNEAIRRACSSAGQKAALEVHVPRRIDYSELAPSASGDFQILLKAYLHETIEQNGRHPYLIRKLPRAVVPYHHLRDRVLQPRRTEQRRDEQGVGKASPVQ